MAKPRSGRPEAKERGCRRQPRQAEAACSKRKVIQQMIEDQRSWTKLDEAGAKGFSIAEAFKIPKQSEGWNAEHDMKELHQLLPDLKHFALKH